LARIANDASEEHAIELALNKMTKEWDDAKIQFAPYKDTGMHTMGVRDEVMRTLDDHIVISEQLLSTRSFKGVFGEPLAKWTNELKVAKDVVQKLVEFQK